MFLAGGASKMREDQQRQLLALFDALSLLTKGGQRIAVGDGGTQTGIMEAAGRARRASGGAFPLIGVAPAAEIPPRGRTPIDPNHSHIVAVDNPEAPAQNAWGSETGTMYWFFAKLTEGRPSVTIVANGGGITLTEVDANVNAGAAHDPDRGKWASRRRARLIVERNEALEPEVRDLRERAEKANLTRRPELFRILPLQAAAAGLRDAILAVIHPSSSASDSQPATSHRGHQPSSTPSAETSRVAVPRTMTMRSR